MLKKIIEGTSNIDSMPIEVSDVVNIITENGHQDKIILVPENTDPKQLLGVYYQYTTREKVYGEPDFTTLIIFSCNVSVEWQRVICCKELVHICEKNFEQTNTQEEMLGLLEGLTGPLSTENYGIADLMAGNDRLAVYQALGILFPEAARVQAVKAINSGSKTASDIAKWTCLPLPLVELALLPDWPELFEKISNK